jgi:hypothetical protein
MLIKMKIPQKYAPYLFAVLMGLSMSGVMTLMNIGYTAAFWASWAKAFAGGVSIGMPTALFASPFINALVKKLTTE